jgi:hypothetical protein
VQGVVGDASDDRHRQAAQGRFELVEHAALAALGAEHQAGGGQAVHRQAAGADLRQHGFDTDRQGPAGQSGGHGGVQAFGLGEHRVPGAGEQVQGAQAFGQGVRVAVQAEHGFQPGEGDLADPQGALEGVLLDLCDQVLAADEDARPAGRRAACRRRS